MRISEEPFEVLLPLGTPCKVIIDVIDGDGAIRDLKSAKRKWAVGAEHKKIQSIIYAWAYRAKFGVPPPYVQFDTIIRPSKTKGAVYDPRRTEPDPRREFGVIRWMEAVLTQMRAGAYHPHYSDKCEEGGCSFFDFCLDHFTNEPFAPWEPAADTPDPEGPKVIVI